jgi:hypothetical protein
VSIAKEYLETLTRRLRYYKQLGEKAFEQLGEKDLHFQYNGESNSIAIIIQHISGNMLSRFTNFLTEDGEKEWRQRDGEFEEQKLSKKELMLAWEKGWNCFFEAIGNLQDEDLLKIIYIRQEPLSVMDALNRQLAHYPHHIGQILYIGKMIKGPEWINLSIPKGQSENFNKNAGIKDPAKKI